MTENEKKEKLIQENLTILLEEFTRDQQVNNQALQNLRQSIDMVLHNQDDVLQQLRENSARDTHDDPMKISEIIRKTMIYCYESAGQSRPVVKQVRFQLFPETDAKMFYKIVFGRWFLMLVILFALACLYRFYVHKSDNNFKIELKKAECKRLKKAWNSLYQIQNTRGKRKMDKIYAEIK